MQKEKHVSGCVLCGHNVINKTYVINKIKSNIIRRILKGM